MNANTTLQQAVQRLRRRRDERGMAVFLVVLVMTMVSAIGVFSMHSASLVDRATGFHRQNVQSTAVVELGARGAATWLGPHKGQILEAVKDAANPTRMPNCAPTLLAADDEASCWVIHSDALDTQFTDSGNYQDGLIGQLSSPHDVGSVLQAELATEVTETFDANASALPGTAGSLKEVTFTTRSRIFPTDGVTTSCGAAARGAVSQQRLRSLVIIQF